MELQERREKELSEETAGASRNEGESRVSSVGGGFLRFFFLFDQYNNAKEEQMEFCGGVFKA